ITFNVVYPMNKIFEDKKHVFSQWLSRGLLFLSHSVIISTLLYAVVVWVMQIEIAIHWSFYLAMFVCILVLLTLFGLLVMILVISFSNHFNTVVCRSFMGYAD